MAGGLAILRRMLETPLIIGAMGALLLAGTVQGTAGFGYGIVSVPILLTFVEPALAVPLVVTQGILVNSLVAIHARHGERSGNG